MKLCKYCNSEYNSKNTSYCSVQCHRDAMNSTPSKYPLSKTCEECDDEFLVHSGTELVKRFCNRSCSTRFNNRKNPKRAPEGECSECHTPLTRKSVWCSDCRTSGLIDGYDKKQSDLILSWLSEDWNGSTPKGALSKTIRNYLISEANNYCQSLSCPMEGKKIPTHPSDDASILEIDHVDGNGENHSPDNLLVICPTCHALTPTYRGRNIGNGRKVYYHRRSYPV